ncbi:MAG: hypothetical protein KC619_19805 [Myxococcales bacterium]|nr:hypothetical protein [Myxococcales bacterium]
MTEPRRSPWIAQVVLVVAFVALAVIGVFTVVVPELTSDDLPEDEGAPAATPAPEAE